MKKCEEVAPGGHLDFKFYAYEQRLEDF